MGRLFNALVLSFGLYACSDKIDSSPAIDTTHKVGGAVEKQYIDPPKTLQTIDISQAERVELSDLRPRLIRSYEGKPVYFATDRQLSALCGAREDAGKDFFQLAFDLDDRRETPEIVSRTPDLTGDKISFSLDVESAQDIAKRGYALFLGVVRDENFELHYIFDPNSRSGASIPLRNIEMKKSFFIESFDSVPSMEIVK
ncbi:MAG: hypothetical protein HY512_04420 [Candidatus Aenigmarchaeota archaeon]|nr:hypothetical protein [Candidatus Aenigmarchaeota archaeon]